MSDAADRARAEARLALLHALIPAASTSAGEALEYVETLRRLRERLHPPGHEDRRWVTLGGGDRLRVDLADRHGADLFYGYVHEQLDHAVWTGLLRPGAVVVDVGAHTGFYTVPAARLAGEKGTVLALEPAPGPRALLAESIAANGLANVRLRDLAAGDSEAEASFFVTEEPSFSGLAATQRSPVREERRVRVRPLDALLEEEGLGPIGALKVDVEGTEAAVLRGARRALLRSPEAVVLMEVNRKNLDAGRGAALLEVLRELEAEGWAILHLDRPGSAPRRMAPDGALLELTANVFLVRAGSPRQEELARLAGAGGGGPAAAKGFEARAVEELIGRLMEDVDRAARGEAVEAGPARWLSRREREELQARVQAVEQESRARLDELRRRDAELAEAKKGAEEAWARVAAVGTESQARLEELLRRTEELRALRAALAARPALVKLLEAASRRLLGR